MSGEGPDSIPTSADPRSKRPTKKRALTPSSSQAATLTTLFSKPEHALSQISSALLPSSASALTSKSNIRAPPEIVTNVQGSSAGAGSGEFHVYKAARRREYERLRQMDELVEQEKGAEEFEKRKEERERGDEERTRRNREKREKMKARKAKGKAGKGSGLKDGGGGGGGSVDGERMVEQGEEKGVTKVKPRTVTKDYDDDLEDKAETDTKAASSTSSGDNKTKPAVGKPSLANIAATASRGIVIHDDDD